MQGPGVRSFGAADAIVGPPASSFL